MTCLLKQDIETGKGMQGFSASLFSLTEDFRIQWVVITASR